MKPPKATEQVLRVVSVFLLASLVASAPARAQVTQKTTPPPPVKPAPKTAPSGLQPWLRQPATPPPKPVPPAARPVPAKPVGAQVAQPGTQVSPGGNNPAKGPMSGVRPPGMPASGGPNPAPFRMPANARSVAMPGGGATVFHPDGRRWVVDKDNRVTAFSRPGMQAKFKGDGSLSSVEVMRRQGGGNLRVERGFHGERETVGVRPGGVRVVTFGKARGYVERPYPGRNGYVQRTSLVGGQTYVRVYRTYRYRNIVYERYVSAYHYQPQFYGWVSNPWPRRVVYSLGSPPGAGIYGGYFAPAPAYPTAALWLTDFVLVQNLKLAYQNHQEYDQFRPGGPPPAETSSGAVPLTPEVKVAISKEVQQQLAEEQTESGGQPPMAGGQMPPPALDPSQRTFVVSQNVDMAQAGEPCALTPGDVIYRTGDNMVGGGKVGVNVLASKAGDCPANTSTDIDVTALQEMHNEFREKIDAGLGTLADNQGQGGLPSGPAAGARPVPEGTAQPDRDVAATLAEEQTEADAAEAAATNGASGSASDSM
jgi:hypothetical protein